MTAYGNTIFAEATAPGRAGVAVIRISGDRSRETAEALCGNLPEPRYLYYRKLERDDELIDHVLVVRFGENASFTGEEVVEIHAHGGRAVVSRILRELSSFPDLRMAEPGEFTRRALMAGRMDLTQVEGLADLIESETELQRKQAMALMNGALSEMVGSWRTRLVQVLALVEASIDFADEEDTPLDVSEACVSDALRLADEFEGAASAGVQGEKVREGFRVALIGAPNAGKSTLLNALMRREVAITSPIAGTTRDIIEGAVDLDGLPVVFQDLAGLRDTDDPVESIGVERAKAAASAADLRVFVTSQDTETCHQFIDSAPGDIVVVAKSDLFEVATEAFGVSGVSGDGVEELARRVHHELVSRSRGSHLFTRERQIDALCRAASSIRRSVEFQASELMAFGLREAMHYLDDIVGEVDADEILGEVFSRFCVGK